MPSFDIVSKVDLQELDNAINSVLRELTNRFDFKGATFSIDYQPKEEKIILQAEDEYKIGQIAGSLKAFCVKRSIDPKALDFQKEEKASGNSIRQEVKLKNGIEQEVAKKITKKIKELKIKFRLQFEAMRFELKVKRGMICKMQ